LARAFQDESLGAVAARLHAALGKPTIGATGHPVPPLAETIPVVPSDAIQIAVVGAHLSGQPLNHELTQRGGVLVRAARTAPGYSLYALLQGAIPKPGLAYDGVGAGRIDVEVWALSASAFGSFVAAIPPPLGIGTVALEDGTSVKCFLCEHHAIAGAENITALGGWRAYLKRRAGK
jgi:allophanate hydrolase